MVESLVTSGNIGEEGMPLTIKPIDGKVFGAIVTGVSLVDMDDKTFKALYQAFLEYGFFVLPEQFLSEQQNIEFGKRNSMFCCSDKNCSGNTKNPYSRNAW